MVQLHTILEVSKAFLSFSIIVTNTREGIYGDRRYNTVSTFYSLLSLLSVPYGLLDRQLLFRISIIHKDSISIIQSIIHKIEVECRY